MSLHPLKSKPMKTILYTTLLALIIGSSLNGIAQKIGYTNVELILSYMPESKAIEKQLSTLETTLTKALEVKQKYYEGKVVSYQEFVQNNPNDTQRKAQLEKEISDLHTEINRDIAAAETKVAEKRNELLKPVQLMMQNAIDEVAVKGGYRYILNQVMGSGIPSILYGDASFDVTNEIAAKLGINIPNAEQGN